MNREVAYNWVATLNELGRRKEPAFLLIDFEQEKPLLWRAAELEQGSDLAFSFPQRTLPVEANTPYVYPGDLLCGTSFVGADDYRKAFEIVQSGLQRGNSFLTNLTMPTEVDLSASFEEIYHLAAAPYRIWLPNEFVCFSPEIFIKIDALGQIYSYPMKGTAEATLAGRHHLLSSQKEIAEHATIVDLIRNDLSQVAKRVSVDRYRYIDEIETPRGGLLQTSSAISGKLGADWSNRLGTIVQRLLPAGSVSGAPKPATVALIQAAEGQKRGYYCGIGLYFDGQQVDSCVLIRYIEERADGRWFFRAGGGITARSDWKSEYAELKAKVRIPLSQKTFSLL